jgi:type IV secretion system protein TrbL
MTRRKLILILGLCLAALTVSAALDPALAATDNSADVILQRFRDKTKNWETTLQALALNLFWLLAGIEFAFSAIRLAFKGADLGEWLGDLLSQILFIGFFYALLTHSGEWAKAIVASFQTAADRVAQANGVSAAVKPSNVFDAGLSIAGKVMEKTTFWHPGDSVGLMFASIVIVVCFALITALMILAMVESYVVISAGVLFMGFGGSRWTKDYAVKTLTYAVSVGAKLFVLELLVALGQQLFQDWVKNFGTANSDILVVVGSAIVMVAVVKTVPDMIQGLINGASVGAGGALLAAAAGVWAGSRAAASTAVGAGMAGVAAGRLASRQLQDPSLNTGLPGDGWLGRTARNLAGAAARNVGERLSGRAAFGTRFGQMADDMNDRHSGGDALDRLSGRGSGGQGSGRHGGGNVIRGDGDGGGAA